LLCHLPQQWRKNLFTVEGKPLPEKAYLVKVESRPEVLARRTLPLRSFRLGLSGQTDIVEFLLCAEEKFGAHMLRREVLDPLSHRVQAGRDQHGSMAYRTRLCVWVPCLEEMLQVPVPAGALFDGKAACREVATFDEQRRLDVGKSRCSDA
jgi:CRISPR-associated exonuclease Cas4